MAELRRWQKELSRTEGLDVDPISDPVELQDVIESAHRLEEAGRRLPSIRAVCVRS